VTQAVETTTADFHVSDGAAAIAGIASALTDIDNLVAAPGPLFLVSVTLTMTGERCS